MVMPWAKNQSRGLKCCCEQVSNHISSDHKFDLENGNYFETPSTEQYQQLMTMLSNHLISVKASDHHEALLHHVWKVFVIWSH